MNFEFLNSPLDSQRFGFKIGKKDDFVPSIEDLIKISKENYKLIITRIDASEVEKLNKLERLGFEIKDVQICHHFDLKYPIDMTDYWKDQNIYFREANIEDLNVLEEIARISFTNYGHYSNNKRLNQEKVTELYVDWTRRSVCDKNVADIVYLAEFKGDIVGFYAAKKSSKADEQFAYGTIGAVNQNYRNKRIFKGLIRKGLIWAKDQNLDYLENNVLISNISSNKVFTHYGFCIKKSLITFHKWIS